MSHCVVGEAKSDQKLVEERRQRDVAYLHVAEEVAQKSVEFGVGFGEAIANCKFQFDVNVTLFVEIDENIRV